MNRRREGENKLTNKKITEQAKETKRGTTLLYPTVETRRAKASWDPTRILKSPWAYVKIKIKQNDLSHWDMSLSLEKTLETQANIFNYNT